MSSIVFDRAVTYYDQTRGFPPGVEQEIARLFVQAGHLTNTSRVVEIGVGTGRIALPLVPHVGLYAGIDLSRAMMLRLREKEPQHNVYLAEGDIIRLPLVDAWSDAIIAVHIFHLVPDWQQALQEAARILKPGAYLLHGGSGQTPQTDALSKIDVLSKALDAAYPAGKPSDVGVRLDERKSFPLKAGWQAVEEPLIYKFSIEFSPLQYLNNVKNRIWSRLWRLTDEELNVCIEAVEAAIAENFDDPNKALAIENKFEIQAFLPPHATQ